ncbi:MAG: DNA polymerase III subunit delta, partial [Muribaculaceae bacterium]|nr:DNA polymerase III subunit delta [Muribaculaceae bacterium]
LNTMNAEEDAFSQKFAPFIHETNVEGILQEIDNAARDISRNANGKLIWFDFLLRLMTLIRIKRCE